jgi:hypothetical protein
MPLWGMIFLHIVVWCRGRDCEFLIEGFIIFYLLAGKLPPFLILLPSLLKHPYFEISHIEVYSFFVDLLLNFFGSFFLGSFDSSDN